MKAFLANPKLYLAFGLLLGSLFGLSRFQTQIQPNKRLPASENNKYLDETESYLSTYFMNNSGGNTGRGSVEAVAMGLEKYDPGGSNRQEILRSAFIFNYQLIHFDSLEENGLEQLQILIGRYDIWNEKPYVNPMSGNNYPSFGIAIANSYGANLETFKKLQGLGLDLDNIPKDQLETLAKIPNISENWDEFSKVFQNSMHLHRLTKADFFISNEEVDQALILTKKKPSTIVSNAEYVKLPPCFEVFAYQYKENRRFCQFMYDFFEEAIPKAWNFSETVRSRHPKYKMVREKDRYKTAEKHKSFAACSLSSVIFMEGQNILNATKDSFENPVQSVVTIIPRIRKVDKNGTTSPFADGNQKKLLSFLEVYQLTKKICPLTLIRRQTKNGPEEFNHPFAYDFMFPELNGSTTSGDQSADPFNDPTAVQ